MDVDSRVNRSQSEIIDYIHFWYLFIFVCVPVCVWIRGPILLKSFAHNWYFLLPLFVIWVYYRYQTFHNYAVVSCAYFCSYRLIRNWMRVKKTEISVVLREVRWKIGSAMSLITRFTEPTWGPSGDDRTQVGHMVAPWTLLSGLFIYLNIPEWIYQAYQFIPLCCQISYK